MERIIDHKWYLPKEKCTKNQLERNGWRYSPQMSDSKDGDVYTYRFSAYRYGVTVTLEGYFWLEVSTGDVHIDVKDRYGNGTYAPFHYYEYGDYTPLLITLDERVRNELNKLGIKKSKRK